MPAMTGMQRHPKTRVYYFRRVVPKELRAYLPPPHTGKTEVLKSLGTKEVSVAKEAAKLVGIEVDGIFRQARKLLRESSAPERTEQFLDWNWDGLSNADAEAIAYRWKIERLGSDAERRIMQDGVSDLAYFEERLWLTQEPQALRQCLATGRLDICNLVLPGIMEEHQLLLAPSGPSWRRLATAVLRAAIEVADERAERVKGNWKLPESAHAPPLTDLSASLNAATVVVAGNGASLQHILDQYVAEVKPALRTVEEWRLAFRFLCESAGIDMTFPAKAITRAHIRDLKALLVRTPKYPSSKHFRGLSLRKLAEKADQLERLKKVPRISATTVNKKLNGLGAVFNWAAQNDYLETNPVAGMRIRAGKPALHREPFDSSDLRAIFTSAPFLEPPGTWSDKQWIPLLAACTGCRLEEIGQLLVRDVRHEGDCAFLAISRVSAEGETKALKTERAERRVPLHPFLIQIGFLTYVRRVSAEGETRLFPALKYHQGKLTRAWSKWFNRLLRDLGMGPTKVFHSFRHLFKDKLRDADVPKAIQDAILGHASRDVGEAYGRGYSLHILHRHVCRVSVDIPLANLAECSG